LEQGEKPVQCLLVAFRDNLYLTGRQVTHCSAHSQRASVSQHEGSIADVLHAPRNEHKYLFAHGGYVTPKAACASITSFATARRIGSYCSSGIARNSFTVAFISCWIPGINTPISA